MTKICCMLKVHADWDDAVEVKALRGSACPKCQKYVTYHYENFPNGREIRKHNLKLGFSSEVLGSGRFCWREIRDVS